MRKLKVRTVMETIERDYNIHVIFDDDTKLDMAETMQSIIDQLDYPTGKPLPRQLFMTRVGYATVFSSKEIPEALASLYVRWALPDSTQGKK